MRVAEPVAKFVDSLASIESVGATRIARCQVGSHPHVSHWYSSEVLRIPSYRQFSAWKERKQETEMRNKIIYYLGSEF